MIITDSNEKAARAAELFNKGYNCSQAVVGAWCDYINLPFETAAAMSSGFGGGMGRMRNVCGAVSGAFMVLGMAFSSGKPGNEEKNRIYGLIRAYAERFKEEAGTDSIVCREILGLTDAPLNAEDKREKKLRCLHLIKLAAALLDEFITDNTINQRKNKTNIKITAFGNFAVYVGNTPVRFRRSKSCEALAFIVDRKTPCTKKQIAAVLFEDRAYDRSCQKYVDNILRGMIEDLKSAGAERLIIHASNSYSVNRDVCHCDYYEYLEGNKGVRVTDEYMSQYSWAEETLAALH